MLPSNHKVSAKSSKTEGSSFLTIANSDKEFITDCKDSEELDAREVKEEAALEEPRGFSGPMKMKPLFQELEEELILKMEKLSALVGEETKIDEKGSLPSFNGGDSVMIFVRDERFIRGTTQKLQPGMYVSGPVPESQLKINS